MTSSSRNSPAFDSGEKCRLRHGAIRTSHRSRRVFQMSRPRSAIQSKRRLGTMQTKLLTKSRVCRSFFQARVYAVGSSEVVRTSPRCARRYSCVVRDQYEYYNVYRKYGPRVDRFHRDRAVAVTVLARHLRANTPSSADCSYIRTPGLRARTFS
ncbi:hypothetical protein EXIGLDRAFT_80811 [Exidia glandulosa HHB12029]|uniref:Uncharacterized protein n=1 Tax=Exidia glandulosa HHB12029 TaxID=1314781 RepID=A0A165HLC5_EXIGL|nr:hypothetical protein EXIGLDRAFT_80811 [Exidia glandulosa HHB12029]